MYSMPAAWHTSASPSALILREASEISVSPAQNRLNPSPVPGPSIVKLKSGLAALSASATPVEIGSTVDEPETVIEPLTAAPDGASLAGATLLAAGSLDVPGAADVPPPDEQAPTANAAIRASAPRRFVVIVTRWFLLGRPAGSAAVLGKLVSLSDASTFRGGHQR